MKLNIYGHQPLIAPRDPVLPMEAATKNYVDNNLGAHANNKDIHLTATEKTWLGDVTATAVEVNYLVGVTSGVQEQFGLKLALAGGTMLGPITLSGVPTENLHATSKMFVEQEAAKRVAKTGDTMTGLLTLSGTPVANLHAATKEYVDSSIVEHANDLDLHMTPAQNTWMDSITVTATEVNRLDGLTSNAQGQIDSKFDKTGGSITGDITLSDGKAVFVSKVPLTDSELVNKAYVDAKVKGQEWKDPISDSNLLAIGLDVAPVAPEDGATYIAGPSATTPWVPGYAYTWKAKDNNWVQLQDRPVAVNDRFGVGFDFEVGKIHASLTDDFGKIITITDATIGSIAYTTGVLTPGSATLVFDTESVKFGVTYTLTDENNWVITNTSVNLTSGAGISIEGNTLSAKLGDGLKITEDAIALNVAAGSVLSVGDGGVTLNYNGSHFEQDNVVGLELSEEILTNISDRLSKTNGGTITGTVTVDTNASLELGYTPTKLTHAVTKQYVDNSASGLSSDILALDGRLDVLEVDPTSKGYVDSQVGTKVSKAGDTMTGPLTLHGAPEALLHAATKGYVDVGLNQHVEDETLHLTAAQNTWIDTITATATEVNTLTGVTSGVQEQLDNKLALAGGILTGSLVLSAAPVTALQAATKQYVDDVESIKVSKAGDTMTGALILHAAPSVDLQAATKKYVDESVTGASATLQTAIEGKVAKTGDTMTGALTLPSAPTATLHAATKGYVDAEIIQTNNYIDAEVLELAGVVGGISDIVNVLNTDPVTKQYVDEQDTTKLNVAGGALTGYLTLHADPQQALHAVSKQYVDAIAQGLRVKAAVRYATKTNLAATYSNGAYGVDSTLTGSGNGVLVVDGSNAMQGDRILVKSQTNKLQNGDYVVQQAGTAGTPFILKRTTTVDESHEVPGSYFFVFDGQTQKGTGWTFNVANPGTFLIGTDDITVNQFSGQGTVIAGDGLTLDGNTIDIVSASPNRIVVNEDSIDLAATGVTPGEYTKLTVDAYGRVSTASKPNTFAGLGLTDVQPLSPNLSSIAAATGAGLVAFNAAGVAVMRELEAEGVGLSIENPKGSSGNPKVKTNATAAATPSTVVARDASGNFAANVITAALTGNASSATVLKDSRNFSVSSVDASATAVSFNGSGDVELNVLLTETGVAAGTYTKTTVDSKGRVTSASTPTAISDLGVTDVYTKAEVDAIVEDVEARYQALFTYVMSRI